MWAVQDHLGKLGASPSPSLASVTDVVNHIAAVIKQIRVCTWIRLAQHCIETAHKPTTRMHAGTCMCLQSVNCSQLHGLPS